MGLGELNIELMEAKLTGKTKEALAKIHEEKARLIRDKAEHDGNNIIGGSELPSYISTDYKSIEGMSDIVGKLANKYSNGDNLDELISEGYVGLTLAMDSFNTELGVSLATHAYNVIQRTIIKYIRKQYRWDNLDYVDNLDKTLLDTGALDSEEEYLREEELRYARTKIQKIQEDLNERELYVLWHTILADEPIGYREIGKQFHCSYESIRRDVNRLKLLLREGD